jgi:hypothetical protein
VHGVAAVHGPTAGAYGDRGGPLKPPELVCVGGARGLDGAPAPRKHSERGGEPQHEVQRGRVRDGVREGDGHAQEVAAVVEQAVGEAPKRSGELRRWGRGLPPAAAPPAPRSPPVPAPSPTPALSPAPTLAAVMSSTGMHTRAGTQVWPGHGSSGMLPALDGSLAATASLAAKFTY